MEPVFGIPPDLVRGPSAEMLPLAGEVNWGMDIFGINYLRKFTNGEGFKIGVVDTGVDDTHPLLLGTKAKDFTGSSRGYRDANGHGTHCTGTVGAIDPRIGVGTEFVKYHGKGLSDGGSGGMSQLLNAMEWCLSEGCKVLSCSWGGGTSVDSTTDRKFREWAERGVWLIFAAGNSGGGTSQTDAPGNSLHCINVAALNPNLTPASFTSAGAKIDTSGPGVNIWSCKPGGGFASMSGTSMATPWVAGGHGLLYDAFQKRSIRVPTVYEMRVILASRSTDTHLPGDDARTGPGYLTPALLAMLLEPDPKPAA